MAQTGFTPLLIYSSSTGGNAPSASNLLNNATGSELAINIADGKLFYKDSGGSVQVIGWKVRPATAGGTGLTSFAVGDLLYADTTTTLAKLADVATGNALISGGVSTAPSWGKIGLTTHVSGTLPVGNGGTGTATAFTTGSVVYAGASGVYSQDNANFFWDGTNHRLGIGTASPTALLTIQNGSATYLPPNPSYYVASFYNPSNAVTKYGLQVRTQWAATENKILSVGNVNASSGADTEYFGVDGLGNFSAMVPSQSPKPAAFCRAWINYTGTTGVINGSFNISSVTRGGAGSYTVNFTTAMPDANYAAQANSWQSTSTSNVDFNINSPSTSGVNVGVYENGASANPNILYMSFFR